MQKTTSNQQKGALESGKAKLKSLKLIFWTEIYEVRKKSLAP